MLIRLHWLGDHSRRSTEALGGWQTDGKLFQLVFLHSSAVFIFVADLCGKDNEIQVIHIPITSGVGNKCAV